MTRKSRKRGRSARNHARNRLAGVNAYRRLTPRENIKAGHTLLARHYVLKTTKKITKKTPTLSHRQYRTKQERERHGVASPEIATRAREAGAIPYRSGRAAETAGKIRRSAYVKRLHREILKAAQTGERINEYSGPGEIKRDRSGKRRGFKAQVWHANYVEDLRERKLTGEELDNGDWHMMMDYAERFKDPARHGKPCAHLPKRGDNSGLVTRDYKQFVTIGSVLSPRRWKLAGRWSPDHGEPNTYKRSINAHELGVKRMLNIHKIDELVNGEYPARRSFELIATIPTGNRDQELSRPRPPKWMDEEFGEALENDFDLENVAAGSRSPTEF